MCHSKTSHLCRAGAMENWGIITFREADLLAPNGSPTNSSDMTMQANEPSVAQLYTVPLTIAHEIAHMWFGAHPFLLVSVLEHTVVFHCSEKNGGSALLYQPDFMWRKAVETPL